MNNIVETAIAVFRSGSQQSNAEMTERLIAMGIERQLATQLLLLVPIAYCRVMLEPKGVYFPNVFELSDDQGRVTGERKFESVAFWSEAIASARQSLGRDDAYLAVAGRSAEFRAINQMLINGSQLKGLVCSPSLIGNRYFE